MVQTNARYYMTKVKYKAMDLRYTFTKGGLKIIWKLAKLETTQQTKKIFFKFWSDRLWSDWSKIQLN